MGLYEVLQERHNTDFLNNAAQIRACSVANYHASAVIKTMRTQTKLILPPAQRQLAKTTQHVTPLSKLAHPVEELISVNITPASAPSNVTKPKPVRETYYQFGANLSGGYQVSFDYKSRTPLSSGHQTRQSEHTDEQQRT